jgi:hypothetical protein
MVSPIEVRLMDLLTEIAMKYGFERLAVEDMLDLLLLFASATPKFSLVEIVGLLTKIPSCRLKKEFEILRSQYWG